MDWNKTFRSLEESQQQSPTTTLPAQEGSKSKELAISSEYGSLRVSEHTTKTESRLSGHAPAGRANYLQQLMYA